jgi:hypothetical protein
VRRRDRRIPDRRLDWRDPAMPVLREMEFGWGEKRLVEVPPDEEQEYCASVVDRKPSPSWKDDPSYRWARPGARKRRI